MMKRNLLIYQDNSYRPKRITLDDNHAAQIKAQRDERASMREHERQRSYFKGKLMSLFSLFKESVAFIIVAAFLITFLTAIIFFIEIKTI